MFQYWMGWRCYRYVLHTDVIFTQVNVPGYSPGWHINMYNVTASKIDGGKGVAFRFYQFHWIIRVNIIILTPLPPSQTSGHGHYHQLSPDPLLQNIKVIEIYHFTVAWHSWTSWFTYFTRKHMSHLMILICPLQLQIQTQGKMGNLFQKQFCL